MHTYIHSCVCVFICIDPSLCTTGKDAISQYLYRLLLSSFLLQAEKDAISQHLWNVTDNIKAYGEQLEAGAKAQADLEALLREERERHAIREKGLLGN